MVENIQGQIDEMGSAKARSISVNGVTDEIIETLSTPYDPSAVGKQTFKMILEDSKGGFDLDYIEQDLINTFESNITVGKENAI